MMTDTLPTRDQVAGVRLAITVESVVDERRGDDAEAYARRALRDYLGRLRDALDEDTAALIDEGDEPEDSEYDREWTSFHGSFFGDVDLGTWLKVAEGYCLDLEGDQVLPDDVVPTLGILDAEGVTPAVAIEHTDEGWGDSTGEPILVASFYVAVALNA